MNSNGDKIYMKIVAFDDIYNFVVQTCFIWSHLEPGEMIYYPDLDTEIEIWVVYRFLAHKMTSNGKSLNYKVIELVESYNCHNSTNILVFTWFHNSKFPIKEIGKYYLPNWVDIWMCIWIRDIRFVFVFKKIRICIRIRVKMW
jgi:hypothetical protein